MSMHEVSTGQDFPTPGLFAGLNLEIRDYQARIVGKALTHFEGTSPDSQAAVERPAHSVMVESPTGSGKTVMGLEIARQMQRRYGYSVGWVAMRRNLLAQADRENVGAASMSKCT